MWAVDIGEARTVQAAGPREVLRGGPETWPACQELARQDRTSTVGLTALSAAIHGRLLPGAIARAHTSEAESTDMPDTNVEHSTGNVFVDLDLSEPDRHLLKAELVMNIDDILRERGITRTETARLFGLIRLDVSRNLCGDFRAFLLERLLRFVTVLGRVSTSSSGHRVQRLEKDCASPQSEAADGALPMISCVGDPVAQGFCECEHVPRRRW